MVGVVSDDTQGQVVVYARVSSADQRADQRADLDRQVAQVTAWVTGQNMVVSRVVTEVGSALNGRRKKFLGLLRDPSVTTIVVEHRDRFARFGCARLYGRRAAANRASRAVAAATAEDES